MWAFHCNAECEFLFLAGLIIGRTSFLSLEALLSHKKKSVFKESKRKTKEREKKNDILQEMLSEESTLLAESRGLRYV